MGLKQILIITATVLAWSLVMTAMGQAAAIAALAPVLGLVVQQIVRAARTQSTPPSVQAADAVPDKEGSAP
ncbi:hypothetical protein [Streptomyces sp. V1I6]|uniref:hypothetical protein n=1 Tax=Streptomyces sp. V1I6 TaxID=3042273 RepID=UPI0027D7E111|nr:hypothetical protein [Streptomyces sp. V1I6]